jgi:hypothetical protein
MLLMGLQSHPAISAQLQGIPQERITTFLDDFFLGPPEDDEAAEPEQQPETPERKPRR